MIQLTTSENTSLHLHRIDTAAFTALKIIPNTGVGWVLDVSKYRRCLNEYSVNEIKVDFRWNGGHIRYFNRYLITAPDGLTFQSLADGTLAKEIYPVVS